MEDVDEREMYLETLAAEYGVDIEIVRTLADVIEEDETP